MRPVVIAAPDCVFVAAAAGLRGLLLVRGRSLQLFRAAATAAAGLDGRLGRLIGRRLFGAAAAATARMLGFHHVRSLEKYTLWGYIGMMRDDVKSAVRKRLNRIEGQVRGLTKMVDEDRYCIDVITQIDALQAALDRVERDILRDHIGHCVEHAIASGNKADQRQKVSELMELLERAAR